ncbi:MAG: ATP-binding protein, partial [Thermodesulfobacteriota bacterium]|nr:ATP-binding protein [Thermodesulfobacteriota bacterium]
RKEWGDLSRDLSIAFDEKQIIDVTATLILDSMYVRELSIWLLDDDVYRCHFSFPSAMESTQILLDLPFIEYLEANPYFLRRMPCRAADPLWERLVEEHRGFLDQYHIELAVPMDVEKGIMGFICAGGQTAGNQYGQDDIDLLSSIAMQSAAAVMSARFAGELSDNRELDTINRVSAFVLHDLKNASGNLSLILQNAPDHMGDPEFVADMLDAMEGSLMRISKVIDRLGTRTLGDEVRKEDICIASFVKGIVQRLSPSLAGIHVILKIEDGLEVNSDPEVVERILENLILNAAQASLEGGEVVISAFSREEDVVYCVADNGPGMDEDFISRRLYRPFQTTKENGTGLGLWQVKQLSSHLGGAIEVENYPGLGVTIRVVLPAQPLS